MNIGLKKTKIEETGDFVDVEIFRAMNTEGKPMDTEEKLALSKQEQLEAQDINGFLMNRINNT